MAKGVGLRLLSRRGSWVQIPPSAPEIHLNEKDRKLYLGFKKKALFQFKEGRWEPDWSAGFSIESVVFLSNG
jgi:hypothetical protein